MNYFVTVKFLTRQNLNVLSRVVTLTRWTPIGLYLMIFLFGKVTNLQCMIIIQIFIFVDLHDGYMMKLHVPESNEDAFSFNK